MVRRLECGRQARQYLDGFESAFRELGFPEGEIQAAAAEMMEIVLGLINGDLRTQPEPITPDRRRPGFTYYAFADDLVEGVYSASPTEVYIEYIGFAFDSQIDASEALCRMNLPDEEYWKAVG